mmetsp:Transcript_65021/g.149189  ORF Transcript_65021/g.149189 Transcript_65021/m.149189 type:complete len:250 (-) Transcript_65021:484-1233(-)
MDPVGAPERGPKFSAASARGPAAPQHAYHWSLSFLALLLLFTTKVSGSTPGTYIKKLLPRVARRTTPGAASTAAGCAPVAISAARGPVATAVTWRHLVWTRGPRSTVGSRARVEVRSLRRTSQQPQVIAILNFSFTSNNGDCGRAFLRVRTLHPTGSCRARWHKIFAIRRSPKHRVEIMTASASRRSASSRFPWRNSAFSLTSVARADSARLASVAPIVCTPSSSSHPVARNPIIAASTTERPAPLPRS